MPIIENPIATKTRRPWDWLLTSNLFPTTLTSYFWWRTKSSQAASESLDVDTPLYGHHHSQSNTKPKTSKTKNFFIDYFKYRFLATWGIKGHDITTNKITCADGTVAEYTSDTLPLRFVITSLLGLPNRPGTMIEGVPQLNVLDVLRGLVGGWTPIREFSEDTKKAVWTDKKIWQIVAIPIKIGVILPVNLLLIPFRIVHNAAKFFTEFLLPSISLGLAYANIEMGVFFGKLFDWAFEKRERIIRLKQEEVSYDTRIEKHSPMRILAFVFIILPIMLSLTVATAIIQYASVWACRAGLALTSPVESARRAYALGRNFTVGEEGSRKREVVSTIVGILGVLVSLSASAVLWTIAFPFAISTLTTLIPQLLTLINGIAQLPFIATSLTTISQWPLVSGSLVLLNKLFATVGVGLSQAFGPAIVTLASAFGAQVTPVVLAVCTTLGMLGTTFIAIPFSWAAGVFSNAWASWTGPGPMTTYINKSKTRETSASPSHSKERDYTPLTEQPTKAPELTFDKNRGETIHDYLLRSDPSQHVVSPIPLILKKRNEHLVYEATHVGEIAETYFNLAKKGDNMYFRLPNSEELTPKEIQTARKGMSRH